MELKNTQVFQEKAQVARYGVNIVRQLKLIHNKGYLHGDVKPDNILIGKCQKKAILIDFG